MTVPYTFGTATTSIPLSNLDANFNTPITLGNTSIYLGNTTTTIGNLTLTNATISSGTVNITNVTVTTANVTNITVSGTANIATGNITTLTSTSITNSALTSGRVTFAGTSGLLSDSSKLTFDTSNLTVGVIGLSANADGATGKLVLRKPNEALGNGQITRMLDFAPYYPGFDEAVVKASIFSGVDTGTQNGQIGFMTATGGVLYEKMRLLANGNLGIGTISPTALLTLGGVAATGYESFLSTGTTTAYNFATISNTGANLRIGIESSTAIGLLTGSSNYSGVIGTLTATSLHLGTNSTVRATIDSSGNVGIGTSSPAFKTEIVGGADTVETTLLQIRSNFGGIGTGSTIAFRNSTNSTGDSGGVQLAALRDTASGGSLVIRTADSGGTIQNRVKVDESGNFTVNSSAGTKYVQLQPDGSIRSVHSNGGGGDSVYSAITGISNGYQISVTVGNAQTYKWHNGGTQSMTLDASGNLLVGATSTYAACAGKLNVLNSSGSTATPTIAVLNPDASAAWVAFSDTATVFGSITRLSSSTLYNTTSDQRLKTNIVDAPLGNINAIKVRSFDWITDGSHQEYGMVAQELLEVAPYAVHQPKNPDEMMAVDYSKLVPMMIKEIQDLKQRIATLENK